MSRPPAPTHPVRSPRLHPGDLVAVLSPASYPTQEHLDETINELESWGLRVRVGTHAMRQHGYMAGTDAQRLDDLNAALRDPEVRAIFASRGGAGAYRISHRIDVDAARRDPKPIIGFSDITNVHMSLWSQTGLVTIHGCVGRNQVADDVQALLTSPQGLTLSASPEVYSSAVTVGGSATGTLVGGNLRELAGWVGCGLPDLTAKILFLEDLRHIGIGQIDRNLTQLRRSGALNGIAGIALGLFMGFEDYVDRGWTLLDVLADQLTDLGVPVLGGIQAGHGGVNERGEPDQRAIVLGADATLDATAGTLQMDGCVH